MHTSQDPCRGWGISLISPSQKLNATMRSAAQRHALITSCRSSPTYGEHERLQALQEPLTAANHQEKDTHSALLEAA